MTVQQKQGPVATATYPMDFHRVERYRPPAINKSYTGFLCSLLKQRILPRQDSTLASKGCCYALAVIPLGSCVVAGNLRMDRFGLALVYHPVPPNY